MVVVSVWSRRKLRRFGLGWSRRLRFGRPGCVRDRGRLGARFGSDLSDLAPEVTIGFEQLRLLELLERNPRLGVLIKERIVASQGRIPDGGRCKAHRDGQAA